MRRQPRSAVGGDSCSRWASCRSLPEAVPSPCLSLRLAISSAITLPHEPVGPPQRKGNRCKAQQIAGGGLMDVEDDEFARERQERNEHHDPRLYDALMPGHDIPQRVIELERD